MSEEREVRVNGEDIAAVADQLRAFADGLPPGQQAVIEWLLKRAANAPAEGDVQGYLGRFSAPAEGGQAWSAMQGNAAHGALFNSLGVQQLSFMNPGSLSSFSTTVGVKF
jgi:hypothetical protein